MDAFEGGQDDDLPGWELQFRFSSGRLCLAFCATVGERWRRSFERLREPIDLGRWVVAAGLVEHAPNVDARLLDEARELREAIYRLVRAAIDRQPSGPADRDLLNTWAATADLAPRLAADGTRVYQAGRALARSCLATVARDAVDLLSGPEITHVRECAASDCALLFVDRSRPGRRRWCSERACGTKNRSAAYRRRRQGPAQGAPEHVGRNAPRA
ncbi:MAG: ABATE domain-containing protein [Actinomycetota bacterium]|jgi:predicted RNA-binding Zn ribbon-like protein|nr:ABATE domain-containing protein [Actinomycetota bacterium]MDA8356102.1 ABATE domain-containing protein [Actinomycetota bacterium]